MKFGIAQKLFLAFLGLTLLVLIATLGLARWSFERGFFEYVNALEQNRLQIIATRLAEDYVAAGSDWSQLSPEQLRTGLSILPARRQGRHRNNGRRKPPRQDAENNRPHQQRRPPRRGRQPRPATLLLDANEQPLAGQLNYIKGHTTRMPITVNGETVGYVLSQLRRQFRSPQETSFARQQLVTSLLIGLASLILAAIVSWWLARILVAPVQRMIAGVKQLSNGDYNTQVTQTGSDELGQLSTDINHLAHTLAENQSSRRRWLADISHELRTPVTILTGEMAALKEGIRPFNEKQLDSLNHETERLRHLIDDLYQLSLSDMGGLRYDFAPCTLDKELQQSIASLEAKATEKGIKINTQMTPGILINADRARLQQLFTNLIQNSLAYTDAPGQLEIMLKPLVADGNNTILLTLSDTPPGVSMAECEQLFEPLYRRDESRNRRTAGAGLGLAICRNIVKAHRAEISAAPAASGGLCISIIFPALNSQRA